ncbi:selenium metabolism-associated LysR family transcriptional regulator [Desulfovibrio sp. X2]|uniref:selenium metabolism-associated LysR family transcriptional regulator n=1 Tax=Desulfovibrio sp. X2 TaxID=941449 RepID=UPI000691473E|nr:selenium metabolism-associated LysR family transcriptional regulator [Desulfovibrio sp. X2]
MDIRRLEAFCKVYELASFSKAGQELFLSQPTISSHISVLEEELGVKLFDRMGRTVLPTQAGELLYGHVKEAFRSLTSARAEIQLLLDKVGGDLVVGASTIPAHYILPELLRGFLEAYPEVAVHMEVSDSGGIIEQVVDGRLICGIVGAAVEHPDLLFDKIMDDDVVLIAPPSLAPKDGQAAALDQLRAWPWIMRERGSGTRKALEIALQRQGLGLFELRVAVSAVSTEAVIQCVRLGLGVSVTSRLAARPFLERGEIVSVPVTGLDMARQFWLVRNSKRSLMPAYRYFVRHVLDTAARGTLGDAS